MKEAGYIVKGVGLRKMEVNVVCSKARLSRGMFFPIGFVPVWLRASREEKEIHGEGCWLEESKCNRSLLCS